MEEARYWMWAKSKPELNPPAAAVGSYGDSWEEQAFAEDAAGALGGCVWPPRSYSCSFCRRDFRSAQALGGHMNVHRRDRARLKQSPNPTASEVVPHALHPCTSAPYSSSQICSFSFNNPNPNPNQFPDSPIAGVIRVSSPPPLVRVVTSEEKEKEKEREKEREKEKHPSILRFFSSPNVDRAGNAPLWSSFLSEKREKRSAAGDPESRVEKEDCATQDLSMNLNLVRRQRQATNMSSDEEVASCKRRRVDEEERPPPLSFLPNMSAIERCLPQSAGPGDDLDLELRLGDAPKVK